MRRSSVPQSVLSELPHVSASILMIAISLSGDRALEVVSIVIHSALVTNSTFEIPTGTIENSSETSP